MTNKITKTETKLDVILGYKEISSLSLYHTIAGEHFYLAAACTADIKIGDKIFTLQIQNGDADLNDYMPSNDLDIYVYDSNAIAFSDLFNSNIDSADLEMFNDSTGLDLSADTAKKLSELFDSAISSFQKEIDDEIGSDARLSEKTMLRNCND